MKSATKPTKPTPEFKVGDHVVATTGATDGCPATGVVCNIGKGWYVITLDQPEAFPMVKSGKISARAGSMAIYKPKSIEPIISIEDEDRDEDDHGADVDLEETAGCRMSEQLKAARVRYAKTKRPTGSASADCADAIARALRDYEPLEVAQLCDKVFNLPANTTSMKYDHLNNGQIRMNSGNRIRAYWKKLWEADNRTEIARVADLVGVVLADDFLDEVAILQESAGLDAIPVECIGNVGV